jgi:hypothetical protein
MENLKNYENSLLKLSNIGPQLKVYLRGWELSLKNFKALDRDFKKSSKLKIPV